MISTMAAVSAMPPPTPAYKAANRPGLPCAPRMSSTIADPWTITKALATPDSARASASSQGDTSTASENVVSTDRPIAIAKAVRRLCAGTRLAASAPIR